MADQGAQQNSSEIKIILNNSNHAKKFEWGNLIHQHEFNKTKELIRNGLALAVKDPDREYLHNTITLLGSRGSGKTSFLLSIKKWIEEQSNDFSSLQVLDIIDPTLIEQKGHVFLNVISLISDLVDKKLNEQECYASDNKFPIHTRKEWRTALNVLAAGLPSIDGIGENNTNDWQDPEFLMDNGLKAVAASQKLFKNFNEFLKISLNIINKNAFLLIFDDIDVDASRGWVVLETIRKYFTGSRLITLISGDLELYTSVIRQKKWQNFGKEILQYEGINRHGEDGLSEFRKLVTKLTAQYMLKIMQPQYRIHLNTLLNRKITGQKLNITVSSNIDSESKDLEVVYDEIFSNNGINNEVQIEVFKTFILSQPLRSQIQFLLLAHKEQQIINNASLTDIFLSDLLDQKVDITLATDTPKYLSAVILKLLLDKQKLEDLYQLQPTTTDESLNASLFSLNLLLSNTIRNDNRFVIFDYIIKIGYLRNLLTILPYRGVNLQENSITPNIEDLCERTGILYDGVLRDVTGKVQSYLYGALELEGAVSDINPFFIQLKGLENIAKQGYTDRIDSVFGKPDINKAERILGFMPCFSGTFAYKNESRIMYSFYMLLAAIGEITKEYETVLKDTEANKKSLLKQLLSELSQLRSYSIVGFIKKQTETKTRGEQIYIQENGSKLEDTSDDKLVDEILIWLESNESITVASHLLGKIATRFFYSMNNIAEASAKDIKLDELFHRQVVSFMNAVLVEDVRENLGGRSSRLNINNTNTDDGIFINNINSLIGPRGIYRSPKLTFSKWILRCPILHVYLKNDEHSRLKALLNRYSNAENTTSDITAFTISNLLRDVSIRSQEELNGNNADEAPYRTVNGTPQLLHEPIALIQLLQEHNIPYEWFVEGANRGETKRRNNFIRQYISSVFLIDSNTPVRIKKFRDYLSLEGIKW